MKLKLLVCCVLLLPLITGCAAISHLIFAALSPYYSGGGETFIEKRYDFEQRMEAAERP